MAKQLTVNLAFTADTSQAKAQIKDLQNQLTNLINQPASRGMENGIASNIKEASNAAAELKVHLQNATNVKTGTLDFPKLSQSIQASGKSLTDYAQSLKNMGPEGQRAFMSLASAVAQAEVPIKRSNAMLKEFATTLKNTARWQISSSILHGFMGTLSSAYGYAQRLNESLNNIRIVTGYNTDQMATFAEQANKAAKALSTTTTAYTDASLIYYQQGLEGAEVQERTDITVKMANVTGQSAQVVSDQLTAIWNNFNKSGEESYEKYADILTALGAATASSTDEIAGGLEKFAAIGQTIGLSYEYAASALATITANTRQSEEVVGTALKTIFARIQGLNLGETLDDGTTLNKYSEALQKIGINIFDQAGELKAMDNILDELGNKWQTLSKDQQTALAQTVAGTRQYTQLVALMDNWDTFQNNLNLASNATGELNKQQKIYMESTQAHLDSLSTSAERLYKSLIDSEGLNGLIDTFSTLVTGVAEYTEAIGGSKSVLLQLGSVATKAFGRTVSQGIATSIANLKKLKEQAEDFNAQAAIIQKFKGIQVNDEAFKELVAMAEAANKYKDTLSEAQVEEANALMSGYNEAVNARDLWQEAKTYAENYYQFITGQKAGSLDHTFSNEQLENYFRELDDKVVEYAQSLGASKKEINAAIADRSKGEIEAYINSATKLIENKLIKNEQIEVKLKSILEKYSKATALEDKNLLSEEEVKALTEFGQVYGEVSDEILKSTKKVKKTFTDAQKGASKSFNTAVDEAKGNWKNFIETIDTQAISQGFIDLAGQIMSIASAVESFVNIPSIWKNEDLTLGEKLLQTLLAIGNVGRGVAATFKAIHAAADLVRTAQGAATVAEVAHGVAISKTTKKQILQTEAVKKTVEEREKEKEVVDDTETEVKEKTQALEIERHISADASHKEIEDELEFASTVALSTQALYEKNRAKGVGITDGGSSSMLPTINALMEHQQGKNNIQGFLQSKGYEGLYSQIPTMTTDRLKAMTGNEAKSKRMSKLFSAISGQGHAKARGEADGFHIENEKGVQELIEFLNSQLPQNRTYDPKKKKSSKKEKPKPTPDVDDLGKKVDDLDGKGGILKILKKDVDDLITGFFSIPTPVLAAAAAIAVLAAGIYLLAEAIETEKEKDERLQKQIDDSVEAYNKATEAANELNSTISSYKAGIDGMQGLTKGTLEYYDAIVKANEAAQALIEKLGLIVGTDYTIGPDGLINIKEDVLTQHAKEAQKETYRAQAGVYSAKAQQVRESSTGIDKTV